MKKNTIKIILCLIIILISILIIYYPQNAKSGAANGLVLCASVVIPSLFPFTFCSIMLLNMSIDELLKPFDFITKKIFRVNSSVMCTFLLSLVSGYPVGALLVTKLKETRQINKECADWLYCCCVNAGPAFIIAFIGQTIFRSKEIGVIILLSHLIPSFLMLLFSRKHLSSEDNVLRLHSNHSFAEIFVECSAKASASMLKICSFVIIFSTLNALLKPYKFLKFLPMIIEITSGVLMTRNVYVICFLLGFGGISVWCQVIASTNGLLNNISLFIISRIIHGSLSVLLCFIFLKIFNINLQTISNKITFIPQLFVDNLSISVCLIFMVLLFFISLFGKNRGRKFKDDML